MVGPIKVTPIMQALGDAGATFKTYFAAGRWVNVANVLTKKNSGLLTVAKGSEEVTMKIDEASGFPISHIREGNLIPYVDNLDETLLTTQDVLDR